MKQLLTLILLTLSMMVSAQGDSIYTVETSIYKVCYSYTKQQPLSLEYRITCPNGKVKRSGDFYTNDSFATSDGYDYADNIWDKGHLAPAASFSCTEEMLKLTFSYLNCVLQHESLNRGVWARLERFERSLAYFYDVEVVVNVDFDENCEVLETGATVPKGFWKTIYWGERTVTFYFPNQKIENSSWHDFMINQTKVE